MLKGNPFDGFVEGGHCGPPLDPDAEDWDDGLGSRDRPISVSFPALETPSTTAFKLSSVLASAEGVASGRSSFSECCTVSVLAIDAS